MKKRTKRILIVVGILAACGIYGSYNFTTDREKVREILTIAFNGDVTQVIEELNKVDGFTNPIINYKYQEFKSEFYDRFVHKTETLENNFDNTVIYDIANIYRAYWQTELLKTDPSQKTDTLLYQHLTDYLLKNKLTWFSRDSLANSIRNDEELTRVIQKEGFQCKFFFLNGFQDLLIWKDERIEDTRVELPTGSMTISVVNIDELLLSGYSGYASFDISVTGGWAVKETPTIYCNASSYDVDSENYTVSFLKHECMHHYDLNHYPNLSSADLEYRSKLVELMNCSEETIYDRIAEFLNGASPDDRSYSHPFAEHCIIRDFSKILFQNDYEVNYDKWLQTDAKKINEAAAQLFKASETELAKNPEIEEVIM